MLLKKRWLNSSSIWRKKKQSSIHPGSLVNVTTPRSSTQSSSTQSATTTFTFCATFSFPGVSNSLFLAFLEHLLLFIRPQTLPPLLKSLLFQLPKWFYKLRLSEKQSSRTFCPAPLSGCSPGPVYCCLPRGSVSLSHLPGESLPLFSDVRLSCACLFLWSSYSIYSPVVAQKRLHKK